MVRPWRLLCTAERRPSPRGAERNGRDTLLHGARRSKRDCWVPLLCAGYDPRLSVVGTGNTIVLIPGMDGTGTLFYRQVPLLARSYRVVTYALRESAPTMDVLVADLAGVIDAVAPAEGRVTLLGESFGGTLALSFALARPERVDRLVVLNSFPGVPCTS
jgi:pimeloyl-ACP methyl ester carboxylesterase